MIKINLKHTGGAAGAGNLVADMDLSGFNLKGVIVCFLLGFGPSWFYFEDVWQEELTGLNAQVTQLDTQAKKLKGQLEESESLKIKLDELKAKQVDLERRLEVVNKVVEQKNNPMKVMLYIAENIPEDVWVNEIEINKSRFKLNGYAMTYKSIGKFIDNLKQSIFFSQRVNLDDYISKEFNGVRVQEFFLRANIDKYE